MTAAHQPQPAHWQVRPNAHARLRRWLVLTVVQTDVRAPDGTQYRVRIRRNSPLTGSPLGPLDGLLPTEVSVAVLLAANVGARGRTGWRIQLLRPETRWRSERVLLTERSWDANFVADRAIRLAAAVQRGEQPWA